VRQRGKKPRRWPISVRGHTLFFGGSVLALPHDPNAPQWIFDGGVTMTWSRLPTMEEFTERLAAVEDFQTQDREVFFGRRGLQLTHIVLFGDSSADSHAATLAAMTLAHASYKGRAINIFIDVSARQNSQVIRHFGMLPPGEPGLRLPSQAFPQVRAMDNGEDGQKNQLDKPARRSFDPTVAAHYVEFAEQLGLIGEGAVQKNDTGGDDDELLMDKLLEVAMLDTRPIVVLDAILPGQTMRLQIADASHRAMVAECLEAGLESQGFGMVGLDPRTRAPLMHGTEVRLSLSLSLSLSLMTVSRCDALCGDLSRCGSQSAQQSRRRTSTQQPPALRLFTSGCKATGRFAWKANRGDRRTADTRWQG
jgi:hypothetical protein